MSSFSSYYLKLDRENFTQSFNLTLGLNPMIVRYISFRSSDLCHLGPPGLVLA